MPEVNTITDDISAAQTDTETTEDIVNIGIELEYPVGEGIKSAGAGRRSGGFYDEWREEYSRTWTLPDFSGDSGYMGHDHTGAEVTSGILDLHSDQPEEWYVKSIQQAREMGYPFAMTGNGDTTFGLHLHLSDVPRSKAEAVYKMCQEPWALVFFCSSVSQRNLCPWRCGGVSRNDLDSSNSRNFSGEDGGRSQRVMNHYYHDEEYDGHYEFRLNEPSHPDHFAAVCHFFRLLDVQGVDAAYGFAHELVHNADDRLTAVKQYKYFYDRYNQFPSEDAINGGDIETNIVRNSARTFYEIMAENGYE